MKRTVRHRCAAFALLGPLAACGVFGGSERGTDQVQELEKSMQRVSHESELAQLKSKAAVTALQKLCAAPAGRDAMVAYGELESAAGASREQEDALRASLPAMQSAADALFASWNADLEGYSSAELRQRSQDRLTATRSRYQAVAGAGNVAVAHYREVNRRLADHVLYFGRDLNAQSLRSVNGEVRALAGLAGDLDKRLADCRSATTSYLAAAGVSSGTLAPAAPGVETANKPGAGKTK